eukprot:CAMPEP_0119300986 /NCGR_PEP_ID=MMETSP1333-20130426/2866_1 /TAXON_ID=418940 /ORGANISM="Scyphosphaera apsteinii, Strain RCC1455" /LENGTH=225 /DNA_ID=CAMNT_0007302949 /DNA_START=69 /DNA_END=749 /DNA_ORIENTATION=+
MTPSARGRKLKCGQCGASYRSTYHGRRPLCWLCQRQRVKENNLLSSPSTSFTKLPIDVLHSIVPYLLVGRSERGFLPDSYCWKRSAHANQDRQPPQVGELVYVFENAREPTVCMKLVCKALNSAVKGYMNSPMRVQAAAKIQAVAIPRGYVFRCYQRALDLLTSEWSDDDTLIAQEWLEQVTDTRIEEYECRIYPGFETRRQMSRFIRIGMMVMQACHRNNGSLS